MNNCENCIYYKKHYVQGQLFGALCKLDMDDVQYCEGCDKFEAVLKGGK